ncbi:MAG: Abi family protein, partial [Oscillospiraceae bacterium]|nr:Abi family protein [Oscillospiraceae bacterium]
SQLIFALIVPIELRLRTQIAYCHSHKYGALGYIDKSSFNKRHCHNNFINRIDKSISSNSNQLFVKHHMENYNGNFPLWVIIELLTLGEISFFYSDMKTADKKDIAKQYHTSHNNLSSWLWCLTNLRNYCAHYSRLYYNVFSLQPATPTNFPYKLQKRIFDYILVLKFLCKSDEKWETSFVIPFEALIEKYREHIKLRHLGFPKNWLELLN